MDSVEVTKVKYATEESLFIATTFHLASQRIMCPQCGWGGNPNRYSYDFEVKLASKKKEN